MSAAPSHAVSVRTYLAVFAGLLSLTLATVWVASVPLGHGHTVMALTIAGAKATLIFLFFMHGLQSGRLTWLIMLGALLGLAIMLSLTLADYGTRSLDGKIRQLTPQGRLGSDPVSLQRSGKGIAVHWHAAC